MNEPKDQPLKFKVIGDRIVMSVGVAAFAYGVQQSDDWFDDMVVVDEKQFAIDVVRELTREEENGDTPFYLLLDKMARKAVENGSVGADSK